MSESRWDELLYLADDVPDTIDAADCTFHKVATADSGDEVELGLRLDDRNQIVEVRLAARGSVLCRAASAVMRDHVAGRSLADLADLDEDAAVALLDVPLLPSRRQCALLAHRALHSILVDARSGHRTS